MKEQQQQQQTDLFICLTLFVSLSLSSLSLSMCEIVYWNDGEKETSSPIQTITLNQNDTRGHHTSFPFSPTHHLYQTNTLIHLNTIWIICDSIWLQIFNRNSVKEKLEQKNRKTRKSFNLLEKHQWWKQTIKRNRNEGCWKSSFRKEILLVVELRDFLFFFSLVLFFFFFFFLVV